MTSFFIALIVCLFILIVVFAVRLDAATSVKCCCQVSLDNIEPKYVTDCSSVND